MRLLPAEGWQRNQLVVTAMVFVVFTGFAFVLPFLPLYVRQLGVRGEEAVALWGGILIGVAPLLAGLLAPVWGRLADRHGQKAMAVRALAAYVVLLLLSAVATNVWQLFALRVGVGLFGGIGPLGLAMATSLAPREQTGRAVGLVQSAQILSAAVGPLAGGYLADWIGIPRTFVVAALLCAGTLFLVVRYYEEPPLTEAAGPRPSRPLSEVLRLPGLTGLLVVLFLVNFVGRSFTPILPLYLPSLGVATARLASATGLLISAYSMTAALSAAGLGRATRRHSPRLLLFGSLLGGAATVLPMALVTTFSGMLLLALLLGLVSGGALTLAYTIGGLTVPEAHRATAFGFFSAAALFGGAVSPSVAGLLVRWDLRGIYYLDTAVFAVLALALLPALQPSAPAVSRAGEG
ncbi:MAG TPA: MFS transporter [Vicinamibacteria bacterium]|nr:MFS transporter [Vicinamibacteria bacterium]